MFGRNARTKATVLAYRKVYGEPNYGQWAFARLLESGGLCKRIDTEEQRAAHNSLVTLLENMGMTQGLNYDRLAEAIFTFAIPDEAIDG